MKRALFAGALAFLPIAAHADALLGRSGQWSAVSGTVNGLAKCEVGSPVGDDLNQLGIEADLTHPNDLTVILVKPGSNYAAGSSQVVTFTFPWGPMTLMGVGNGDAISVKLNDTTAKPFVHGFTKPAMMTVTAFSDGVPWIVDLAGTTPAVTAMAKCTMDSGFNSLPYPFISAQQFAALQGQPNIPAMQPQNASPEINSKPAVAAGTLPPTDSSAMPVYQTDGSATETSMWQTAHMYWQHMTLAEKENCEAIPPGGAQPNSYSGLMICVENSPPKGSFLENQDWCRVAVSCHCLTLPKRAGEWVALISREATEL
jgi:hypothetical protein